MDESGLLSPPSRITIPTYYYYYHDHNISPFGDLRPDDNAAKNNHNFAFAEVFLFGLIIYHCTTMGGRLIYDVTGWKNNNSCCVMY